MPDLPPLPESISGCVLEGTLRSGAGMVVVRARDALGLPLDMYLFPADVVAARVPKTVFFDQVRATAALHHERLSTVVNAGEKGAWWFVACKGTEGATLANLFQRGHLDEERALAIFAGVADGLAALEAAGLRHGALEPTAVGLPGAGQVRLSLRRLVPVDLAGLDARYLSPEEARGEDGGSASDLFVLGLLIAEALYGRPLLQGAPEEIRVRVARGEVPAASAILRGVLPQTVDLVSALLSPVPRSRPASAADVGRILRALQAAFTSTESLEGSFAVPVAAVPVALPDPDSSAIPSAPPAAPAAAPRSRRAHARLIVPFRGVEQIHELLDPVTWIGVGEGGRIVARGQEIPGAVARLEVGAQADTLFATGAEPKPMLRGQGFTRTDLQFGDTIRIGDEEVVFEKAGRLLPEGEEGAEEGRSHRLREKPSRLPLAAGAALCLAALAWGLLRNAGASGARSAEMEEAVARAGRTEKALRDLPPAAPIPSDDERSSREETAFRLLARAREDRGAGKARQAREKIESLLRQYPDAAASLLAAEDLRELRASRREEGAEELREVQAKAEALSAGGRNGEAFELLHAFADAHGGTLAGDRAGLAAETVSRIASDRVDDLLRAARAAADRKDWQAALEAAGRAEAVAAGESRRRATEERERILRKVPRGSPGDAAPGEAPPKSPEKGPGPPDRAGSAKEPSPAPGKPPAPKPTGLDEEAGALFRSSREALEQGRLGEAERGFYRLLAEFRDAKIVRDYGTEVAQRLVDAVKKGRGVAGLFHGGIQFKGTRTVLTYEFEEPGEASDFETVHPFLVPNRGTFRAEHGELTAQGAAAFMMRAAFRPDAVVMSFRINPGSPAQDMGAMLAETKDPANHLLFTIANDFFKLGKGAKAYPIPGNVIFVFGKGMWKDADPGMVGFVKTAVSEEPKVPSRKWSEVEVAKERDRARFVLEGKTLAGRAIGDNKYELTGIRPALFVLLSEARFDEVTIEGDLDPAWVLAERERVFPELR